MDGKYDFLETRDVISVANTGGDRKDKEYVEITYKRNLPVKDFLKGDDEGNYLKGEIERSVGRQIKPNEKITVLEFKRTYEWKFDPAKRL